MTLKAFSRALDEVAAHLPFAVDDYDRANEAFVRWVRSGADEDLRVVDLWVYCYVRRYFLTKFVREPERAGVSLDEPVGEAFQRVRGSLGRVERPERFASYVSVICKRAYLTFLARHAQAALVDFDRIPEQAALPDPADDTADLEAVAETVKAAIERLPESLREVARLRLLEQLTYEELEEKTGRSQSVLRSYIHKAFLRLREDPDLQRLLQEWDA